MHAFRLTDLPEAIREVFASAATEPTVLVNRGQPNLVLMPASEYRRLKMAAGEPVPAVALPRRPLELSGLVDDPLGYDTADLRTAILQMAEDALSVTTTSGCSSGGPVSQSKISLLDPRVEQQTVDMPRPMQHADDLHGVR